MFKSNKKQSNSIHWISFGRVQDDLRVIAKLRMTTDQMREKKTNNTAAAAADDDEFCVYDVFYEKPTVVSPSSG